MYNKSVHSYSIKMNNEIRLRLRKINTNKLFSKENIDFARDAIPHMSAMLTIVLTLVWLFVNWVSSFMFPYDFGWNSPYKGYIIFGIILFSVIYALYLTYDSIDTSLNTKKVQEKLERDISNEVLTVLEYPIYAVKIFEEPEHGGLLYFLLTYDKNILVFIDSESQSLAIQGGTSESSSLRPRELLKIYRTPLAKFVIKEEFVGTPLIATEWHVLTSNTEQWLEHGSFVKTMWDKLGSIYGD